jgi:type IV pilus assembly protein PilM
MGEGKNLIGVDIGSSAIKVCQVKETRKGLLLQRVGFAPLPPRAIVDGQVRDASMVVETLRRVFSESKIRLREVALSVSGQSVIIRKISVPLMTAQELSEQISWEAEQHIPFDIKDVQVDYQVLRRRPDENQMDLLLVAAKKDQINDYAQLARDAKLRPVVVDIDAFTLQNLFEATVGFKPKETVALVNVGANLTSLNIAQDGVSAFTREIANGGSVLTDEIQRKFSTSFEHAEAMKCGVSADGSPIPVEVSQLAAQAADSIAAEIQRSLDFFLATSGDGEIHRLLLTGGTANLPALATSIERRVRVPVEVWYPTQTVALDTTVNPQLLQQRSTQLAVALGLALRRQREARS